MKLLLQNTSHGLIPLYDADYEEKKRLKIGEVYTCEIKQSRNIDFHRKYFALINCAWHLQSEARKEKIKTVELFRKSVQLAAGYCELVYSHKHKDFIEMPSSISFEKLDNIAFERLYKDVRHVIDTVFCSHISIEDFEKYLINF